MFGQKVLCYPLSKPTDWTYLNTFHGCQTRVSANQFLVQSSCIKGMKVYQLVVATAGFKQNYMFAWFTQFCSRSIATFVGLVSFSWNLLSFMIFNNSMIHSDRYYRNAPWSRCSQMSLWDFNWWMASWLVSIVRSIDVDIFSVVSTTPSPIKVFIVVLLLPYDHFPLVRQDAPIPK